MHYYKRHIGDYSKDTGHLTMLEHGAYARLMDVAYATEKALPTDVERTFRMVNAVTPEERQAVEIILGEFWQKTPEGFVQGRVEREIAEYQENSAKASEAGKKSGETRRKRREESNDRSNGRLNLTGTNAPTDVGTDVHTDAELTINHKPLTTNQYPLTPQGGMDAGDWPTAPERGSLDEARLFEKIRLSYVRVSAPGPCLQAIEVSVEVGKVNPHEILSKVLQCAMHIRTKAPGGGANRLVPQPKRFFSEELWNDPAVYEHRWDGTLGGAEKKEGAAVSGHPPKRKHALDAEPEAGWRKVLAAIVEKEGYALDPETVPWKELAGDIRQMVKDQAAAGGSTPDMLDPRAA